MLAVTSAYQASCVTTAELYDGDALVPKLSVVTWRDNFKQRPISDRQTIEIRELGRAIRNPNLLVKDVSKLTTHVRGLRAN